VPHAATIRALGPETIDAARALLTAALPHDRIDLVADEKLFGDNGARSGAVFGAFENDAWASWPPPAAG
jgi:hypothetical protein